MIETEIEIRSDKMHTVDITQIAVAGLATFVSAGYLVLEFIRARKA